MFISNDSNYTFGQFLANENGDDIKAPVYTKCFTDTEELKGYRFIHDPEETDPEKCVSFSVYDAVSEEATATPFLNKAAVADLTSVMFRLDAKILDDGAIRELPFYHVIVPVENITDGTLKYLVIQMTKEVEIFPENYPYYELVDTFADAEPTSADAPSGGGGEGGDGNNYTIARINFAIRSVGGATVEAATNIEFTCPNIENGLEVDDFDVYTCGAAYFTIPVGADATYSHTINAIIPDGKAALAEGLTFLNSGTWELTGNIQQIGATPLYWITGDCTLTLVIEK